MCDNCSAEKWLIGAIESWAADPKFTKKTVICRRTAATYPNTFVFVFTEAVMIGTWKRDIYVDVHYEGDAIEPGKKRNYLGGLWVKGVKDQDMKPQQHGGILKTYLEGATDATAPAKWDTEWGAK